MPITMERRLHHARLRTLVHDAVRRVSIRARDRVEIELDDPTVREHAGLLHAASLPPPPVQHTPDESAPVPALSIAILIVGSRGDVQPFLPIAQRLARDGHRVRLATHAVFREFVESHGIAFFPLAGDPRELMEYMVMTGGHLIPRHLDQLRHEVPRKREIMADILASTWSACTEPDPGRPDTAPFVADAVIANPPSQGHIHVAEALHAPLHIMFTMPWSPTHAVPHPFTHVISETHPGLHNRLSYEVFDLLTWLGLSDLVNEFRERTLGLEPVHLREHAASLVHELAVPHAYLWSPSVLPKPADWGPQIDVTGFVFLDEAAHYEPPDALREFLSAGDPPVYVGFGSCPAPDPAALTATIFEGLERAGVRGLVARGWARLGAGAPPAQVHLVDDLPHDWLFPRCAAVCHHGGAGTTAAGLRSGLPTIVVPFFGDQYFWGRIIAESGAGPVPVPIGALTAETLAEAIAFAQRPEVRARAQALGEGVRAQAGHEEAVAAFYAHLPLVAMRCNLDPTHLARRRCEDCGLAFCRLCDAVVHDDPARRPHQRQPLGHVAWDVSGSPSLLERLERALAGALTDPGPPESETEPGSWAPEGVVLPRDSAAAKLHGRPTVPAVDRATRARILEHFESTRRREHARGPVPAA
jgi:UDP:flavonoid glycosyltransferase YjiC (YdhE family)